MIPENAHAVLWITEFPMFEFNEDENRYEAMHHPFTAPNQDDAAANPDDLTGARAIAYDLVYNGVEIGGGSLRIYRRDVQEKVFRAIGLSDEEAENKFGYLMEAFQYGAPPHGGLAFGLDRLVMMLAGGKIDSRRHRVPENRRRAVLAHRGAGTSERRPIRRSARAIRRAAAEDRLITKSSSLD